MAIVQASLTEEILSRQERAVLRGIYRAAQLAEGIQALDKVCLVLDGPSISQAPSKGDSKIDVTKDPRTNVLRSFLSDACVAALAATKVPTLSVSKKTSSSQINV